MSRELQPQQVKRHIVWMCAGCDDCEPAEGEAVRFPCSDSPSMNGAEVVLAEDYDRLLAAIEAVLQIPATEPVGTGLDRAHLIHSMREAHEAIYDALALGSFDSSKENA